MCVLTGANSNSMCEYCVSNILKERKAICDISWKSAVESAWFPAQFSSCSESYQFYNVNEHRSLCCNQCHSGISQNVFIETGKTRRRIDPHVLHGTGRALQRQCSKLTLQKTKRLLSVDILDKKLKSESQLQIGNFTGLQCRTNRTLKYYYLDSRYHSVFAEKLGITVSSSDPKVIITDLKVSLLCTLKCLSIGTPNAINFPFVSNEKLVFFRCSNIQAHCNEAVIYLNFGTPKNNEFSICNKWKIYYFLVSQYLSTLG